MSVEENGPECTSTDGVSRVVGYIAMRDGVRLACIIWRPHEEGRYPAVLMYATYGESGMSLEGAKRFLEAGYAFVGVNVRGTGASEGTYSYYQPTEGPDGFDVVEWIAAQPWSSGDVGMVGGSYQGHTQIKVAALRPPHLRAIVPISIEGNEYRDECCVGGLFNAGLMTLWTFDIQPGQALAGAKARVAAGDTEWALTRKNQLPNRAYDEVLHHPFYDDWWRARALDTMVEKVVVPTLIIQAWQDEWIRPNGAIRLFKLLGSQYKRIILQNGPHKLTAYKYVQDEQIRWLDRWVRGSLNGIEAVPPVTVHWEVVESQDCGSASPNWTTAYEAWPVPGQEWVTFYLTGTGHLSTSPPAERVLSYRYPLGTELPGSVVQFALKPHPLGSLSYRTAPLNADMVLLGAPQVTLYFCSDRSDTDFLFTLNDVDPDGNTLFLQRSVMRASMRVVDEELSTSDEIIQSFAAPQPLVPDEITELTLSLSSLGHVVRAGHSLELSVLAPSPIPNPVWGFVPISAPAVNKIYHGGVYPSKLLLPVIPGEVGQRPRRPLGALRNQPFRTSS